MKLTQYSRTGVRTKIGADLAPIARVIEHIDRDRIDLEIWASCDSKRTLVRLEMTAAEARELVRRLEEVA